MKYGVLDLETGGFNRDKCCVMEVGLILLDENFAPLGEFDCPVNVTGENGDAFEPGAVDLHMKTGLFQECAKAMNDIRAVDAMCAEFMRAHGFVPSEMSSMAGAMIIGRNPEFDHAFAKRLMPLTNAFFHYRTIDVSTVVQIAAIASGLESDRLKLAIADPNTPKGIPHRALADCRLALRQLTYLAKWYNGQGLLSELKTAGLIA